MKNKILKVFATLSLLALVTVSCDDANSDNVSNEPTISDIISDNNGNSTNTPSNDTSSGGLTPIGKENNIKVIQTGMSTVSPSVIKSAAGETITVTVTPDSGYTIVSVSMNDSSLELNRNSDGVVTVTFVMPDTTARISVATDLLDKSGIVITSDVVSAKLVEEVPGSGIYVARNVRVENDTSIGYTTDGGKTLLSITKINNSKSFAGIGMSSNAKNGFSINGNAIYDFYYDNNDQETPCYVQRTGIINLPTTADTLYDLLEGKAKSDSTLYPANLNHVEYTSETDNVIYKWDLYSANSSYAVATNITGRENKGIVYKAQEGNKYTVVNSYLEANMSERSARSKTYGLESIKYSGQFDVVSVNSDKYSYTQAEVDADASFYSHSTSALEMEFYEAYRNGYVGNVMDDVEVASDTTVSSEYVGSDGEFKVTCDTWVRWENSSYYDLTDAYKTYNLEITFTKAGAIKEATYEAYTYDSKSYDFTNKKITGEGTNDDYISVKYGYGNAKSGQPKADTSLNLDLSKYFVSEISSVSVKGINSEEGKLGLNENIVHSNQLNIDSSNQSKINVTPTFAPETALDTWQYTISSTGDSSIVGYDASYGYYKTYKAGTTTLEFTNHTQNANEVTKTVSVTVESSRYIRSIYLNTIYPYNDYDETWNATGGIVNGGRSYDIKISGSNINGGLDVQTGLNCTFTFKSAVAKSGSSSTYYDLDELAKYLIITYDNKTGYMHVDATKATKDKIDQELKITVEISSEYLIEDIYRVPSFTINFYPGEVLHDSLVGTWNCSTEGGNANDKVVFDTATTGSIHLYSNDDENPTEEIYNFTYTYNSVEGKITAKVTTTLGVSYSSDSSYTLVMVLESADSLGVGLIVTSYTYSDSDGSSSSEVILGSAEIDDEYGNTFTAYYFFELAK